MFYRGVVIRDARERRKKKVRVKVATPRLYLQKSIQFGIGLVVLKETGFLFFFQYYSLIPQTSSLEDSRSS